MPHRDVVRGIRMADHWIRVLSEPEFLHQTQEDAKRLIAYASGATEKTVQALLDVIGEISEPAPAVRPDHPDRS